MTATESFELDLVSGERLQFLLQEGVFRPTGTSQVLITAVQESLQGEEIKKGLSLLDLGCGCGVGGLSLAKLDTSLQLSMSDFSESAVNAAKINAVRLGLDADVRLGSLFEPWTNQKFDIILDDVSGVAEEIAKQSGWFTNVPCAAGRDGTDLIISVIKEAPNYLTSGGIFFFPVLSLSNSEKILEAAERAFNDLEMVKCMTWSLPQDLANQGDLIDRLVSEGKISLEEKFGLKLWSTKVYLATNPK